MKRCALLSASNHFLSEFKTFIIKINILNSERKWLDLKISLFCYGFLKMLKRVILQDEMMKSHGDLAIQICED